MNVKAIFYTQCYASAFFALRLFQSTMKSTLLHLSATGTRLLIVHYKC